MSLIHASALVFVAPVSNHCSSFRSKPTSAGGESLSLKASAIGERATYALPSILLLRKIRVNLSQNRYLSGNTQWIPLPWTWRHQVLLPKYEEGQKIRLQVVKFGNESPKACCACTTGVCRRAIITLPLLNHNICGQEYGDGISCDTMADNVGQGRVSRRNTNSHPTVL